MTYSFVRGDARRLPFADGSVDLVVTSPPYFDQRAYADGGDAYDGQIGAEPSAGEYLQSLWAVCRELWRVLKPDGSVWVNIGDKRAGSSSPGTTSGFGHARAQGTRTGVSGSYQRGSGFGRDRSKMMLPHRFAIGCEDGRADPDGVGWIVRQDQVWSKAAPMPEPVVDRTADGHEYWFHLCKTASPYAAVDVLRGDRNVIAAQQDLGAPTVPGVVVGRRAGSVWTVGNEPLRVPSEFDVHTAAFPSWWPQQIILGWSPPGVCVACGQGRRPLVLSPYVGDNNPHSRDGSRARSTAQGGQAEWEERSRTPDRFHGWVCDCAPRELVDPRRSGQNRFRWDVDGWVPPATVPAVVLDPFVGSGTTVAAAHALGRHGIGVDMSASYLDLARWRVEQSGLVGKVRDRVGLASPGRTRSQSAAIELALF